MIVLHITFGCQRFLNSLQFADVSLKIANVDWNGETGRVMKSFTTKTYMSRLCTPWVILYEWFLVTYSFAGLFASIPLNHNYTSSQVY